MASWEVRVYDPQRAKRQRWLIALLCLPLAFVSGVVWPRMQPPAPVAVTDLSGAPVVDEQLQRELDELRQRVAVLSSADTLSQQANGRAV